MFKSLLLATTSIWLLIGPILAQTPRRAAPGAPEPAPQDGLRGTQRIRESSPPIKVATVEFVSDAPLPSKAEERLRRYMTRRAIYDAPDWLDELESRVKDAWQQYGYFRPDIQTTVRPLGQNPIERNFALTFHVAAGRQYRLSSFSVEGAKLFSAEILRSYFGLQEGDIFDTYSIRAGLESVRSSYDSYGYINLAVVPAIDVDDLHGRIALMLDIAEGQQFCIGETVFLGLQGDLAEKLIQGSGIKKGATFSTKLIEDFFRKNRSVLPNGLEQEADVDRRVDDATATVDLIFHFDRDK